MVSCAEDEGRGARTLVYFSDAVFLGPSGIACIPLEAPAPPSDEISASDPTLSFLSTRADFFVALGFAGGFFAGCFVGAFVPFFCALNKGNCEPVHPCRRDTETYCGRGLLSGNGGIVFFGLIVRDVNVEVLLL